MTKIGTYRVGMSLSEINKETDLNLTKENLENILNKVGIEWTLVNPIEQVLNCAKKVVGRPYKRGASVLSDAPYSFDCSSLVSWTAVEAGYAIPRVTIDQYVFSQRVDKSNLIPSDLVFANTREIIHTEGEYFSKVLNRLVKEEPIRTETLEYMPGTKVPDGVDHVGIYISENKIIHSSSKYGGVVEQNINESDSFKNIIGYGRIIESDEGRYVVSIPDGRPELRTKENLLEEIHKFWQIKE